MVITEHVRSYYPPAPSLEIVKGSFKSFGFRVWCIFREYKYAENARGALRKKDTGRKWLKIWFHNGMVAPYWFDISDLSEGDVIKWTERWNG